MHWFFKLLIVFAFASVVLLLLTQVPRILPTKIVSNTEIYGLQFQNQIWDGEVKVTGDLINLPGTLVSIKPGTQIIITTKGDKSNFDILPWHLKNGINTSSVYHGVYNGEPFWDEREKIQLHLDKVSALGTKEQPISFKPDTKSVSPYDINSINIKDGIITNSTFTGYRRFEVGGKVVIRDSKFTNTGECAVCINKTSPTITNNTFENSLREYIWIYKSSPRISGNKFYPHTKTGIRVDPQRLGNPVIINNEFMMDFSNAIEVLSGNELQGGSIILNTFSGDSIVKIPCDSKINITQNVMGKISFILGSCANSYKINTNYWGTTELDTVIKEKFLNKEKNLKINIDYLLPNKPKNVGVL